MKSATTPKSLEQQRKEFCQSRFLAMPIAGTIVWALLGLTAPFLSETAKVWSLYIGTGAIFYIGAGLSYLTGEKFFQKREYKNEFEGLFLVGIVMSLLVFSISIPFVMVDHTSLPLSIGILAGLMWMPFSWIIKHWIGYFHTLTRTALIVAVWFLFPEHRFEIIPAVIVAVYIVSIIVLELRYRHTVNQAPGSDNKLEAF